jgi:predicted deacylase
MPEVITLNKHNIALGEDRQIDLKIARLPTYTNIDLPVHIYRGPEDGPVLLMTGGLHGDEINGIEIIRRMINRGAIKPQRGTVIALPLVNVYGFIQSERGLPDGKDINRSFPGVKNGSLARLLAYTLMNEIVPHIDVGVDFHTGGSTRANYPQVRAVLDWEENKRLAEAFASPFIVHSKLIDKSFRKAAHKKGKNILVYEVGESLRFDEFGIEEGVNGALRLMHHMNMIDDAPDPHKSIWVYDTTWIRARYAGLFRPLVDLGAEVKKREVVGTITDPFGDFQYKIKAPASGHIIGLNNNPVIHKGDALMHLGKKHN